MSAFGRKLMQKRNMSFDPDPFWPKMCIGALAPDKQLVYTYIYIYIVLSI